MKFSRARLRGHRDGRKLSEAAVAEAAGLAPSVYTQIEIGRVRPTGPQLDRIAAAVGVPTDELCSAEPLDYDLDYAEAVLQYVAPMSDEDIERVAAALGRARRAVTA